MTTPAESPALRVVRGGEPSEAELAALVVALATVSRAVDEPEQQTRTSAWPRRAQLLRQPLPHGRDAWRRSLRP